MLRVLMATWLLLIAHVAAAETTLRIGLQDDPDMLDPALSRSYAGRVVFAALCDKLVDTAPDLTIIPQLATAWNLAEDGRTLTFKLRADVSFQNGEAFDADAVKANLERYIGMPDSVRKSELASVESVEVIDKLTVALKLKHPDATLLAQLTDRAGMMVAPKAAAAPGFAAHPVCSGPYLFHQRIAQDRIVLDRFAGYWNAGAYHFDHVVYLPIPDATVRLANLRAGDLDFIEHLAPSDLAQVQSLPGLQVMRSTGLGYADIMINVGNGSRANSPLGSSNLVRQAFAAAIDRDAINQVVFNGLYAPNNQPFPPVSPYHDPALPIPPRDLDHARALLKQAGVTPPLTIELMVSSDSLAQQAAQAIQAMAGEAGFDVQLRVTEFATMLKDQVAGDYQADSEQWSGRIDPDGNIFAFVSCHGSFNQAGYCNAEVDRLLNQARLVSDLARRRALYHQVLVILQNDLPQIYLFTEPRLFAATRKLSGFIAHPDGLIRLRDVSFAP